MIELPIPPREEREPNPTTVALLIRARELMCANRINCHMICGALYNARWITGGKKTDGADALLAIEDGVAPYRFYCNWAEEQLLSTGLVDQGTIASLTRADYTAGRLRWIDQLIEEFGGVP